MEKRPISATPPPFRPKPPPLVMKRSASLQINKTNTHEPQNDSSRKESTSNPDIRHVSNSITKQSRPKSPKRSLSKKSTNRKADILTVKSPLGEVLVLSTSDLRESKSRPDSAETHLESSASLSDFAQELDATNHQKTREDADAKFIDQDGRFIKWDGKKSQTSADSNGLFDTWESQMLHLARILQINRHTGLLIFHAFYAGLCLYTLIMLPSIDPLPSPPQNDINDPTYQFHIWYAPRAQGTSYLLNFFVTIAILSACDIVWGSRRTVSHSLTSRAFITKCCIMICILYVQSLIKIVSLLSIISNSILVGYDEELYLSFTDKSYGGKYGFPGWFILGRNALQGSAPVKDLQTWKTLNAIRGLSGIFNWVLCVICIDKSRLWSIVDSKPNSIKTDIV